LREITILICKPTSTLESAFKAFTIVVKR